MDDDLIYGLAPAHYAAIAEIIARFPAVERVLIYGSRAKGSAKPASDFDLAVFGATLTNEDFARLWAELDALPLAFKLDVLHWDTLGNEALREKIRAEGKAFSPLRKPGA
ncbi:nucleotidyltransferase family protein [Niveibacterium microcysteis]|uniref:Nucleotidyltransferase domain-containing protein n=1 Tax=Niveibacterium microcysteis TaxID=2811415 RepID=A0ABX7M842_9RHOO|nr:nucleotidyltransferase domain-containing protein [Niveibacterium microcysteis]QSI76819.1 nucleotidyltransferase domain-containing protein [Niveibacterium microcysteis]